MPFPISDKPWQHISMDFVLRLPKTFQQHDSIMVVVDCFSKMSLFLQEVVRLHQNILFHTTKLTMHQKLLHYLRRRSFACMVFWFWLLGTSNLWVIFGRPCGWKMGTKLMFSSAFHPQTDGQTEVTNGKFIMLPRCGSCD
jgi:hypothetical protein